MGLSSTSRTLREERERGDKVVPVDSDDGGGEDGCDNGMYESNIMTLCLLAMMKEKKRKETNLFFLLGLFMAFALGFVGQGILFKHVSRSMFLFP
jgi:hypothetical protein